MPEDEEKLCAPRDKLISLVSTTEEFVKGMKDLAAQRKASGIDTTVIDKSLANLSKQLRAHRRALRM